MPRVYSLGICASIGSFGCGGDVHAVSDAADRGGDASHLAIDGSMGTISACSAAPAAKRAATTSKGKS
jgi:hypothetical protein